MKIAMLCARYLPFSGGTETHVSEVSTRLVRRGHGVTVLTADPNGVLPSNEVRQGVEIRRLAAYPKGRDWCFAPALFEAVAQGDWDIMHVQGYHTFFAPLGMMAAARRGLPFAVTFHSGGHSSFLRSSVRRLQHRMLAPLASKADRLIGVSRFEADLFSRRMGISRDRFAVVPNGARLPVPSAAPAKDEEGPLIVSLGRLERYKGHHRAIAAFRHVVDEIPTARLRILGEGPYEEPLRRMAVKLGLEDRIQIGSIPPTERGAMADLLSSASLVVLLSDYEAHPVAVMEALSVGVPVLTTHTSGFCELAEDGLVSSVPLKANPAFVARAMRLIMSAEPTDAQIRLPDWEDCTDRLLAIYHGILSGRALESRLSQPAFETSAG